MSSDWRMAESPGPVEVTKVSEAPVVYSNVLSLTGNADEVILTFGMRDHSEPGKAIARVTVVMTAAEGKRTALAMADLVQRIEVLFGEIITEQSAKLTAKGKELFPPGQKEGE